jgi:hypothetical protein
MTDTEIKEGDKGTCFSLSITSHRFRDHQNSYVAFVASTWLR